VHVLVVSQFFPPEPGATQNRLGAFADGLLGRGHEITVICEQPNHPSGVFQPGFGRRPLMTERDGRMIIRRVWVAASPRKTPARRLAFYASFAAGATAMTLTVRRPDVCFASSPPLPGVLAVADAARFRRIPLVVDVRDVWPAAAEALGELSARRLIAAFERAERRLYRQAHRVTTTTRAFCTHIDHVSGMQKSVHLPNGALDELVAVPYSQPPADREFRVGYAGNLGIAQGLGIVIAAAEQLEHEAVRFILVGDGAVGAQLRAELGARRLLHKVEIRPPVAVSHVGEFLRSCHALLIPLRDHRLLGDFIPSKLYDAMAVGRPAIVAARGEAAKLVEQTGCGLVIEPEDGIGLAAVVRALALDPATSEQLGRAGKAAAAGLARSRQIERLERVLSGAAALR
jgi:glycosyltransferase involved in cell wall biosynthesis